MVHYLAPFFLALFCLCFLIFYGTRVKKTNDDLKKINDELESLTRKIEFSGYWMPISEFNANEIRGSFLLGRVYGDEGWDFHVAFWFSGDEEHSEGFYLSHASDSSMIKLENYTHWTYYLNRPTTK